MIIIAVSVVIISKNQKSLSQVKELIKYELNLTEPDISVVCLYDDQTVIVSVSQTDYFIVRDNQIKILDIINKNTQDKYPKILVDKEFIDIYWLLENCK